MNARSRSPTPLFVTRVGPADPDAVAGLPAPRPASLICQANEQSSGSTPTGSVTPLTVSWVAEAIDVASVLEATESDADNAWVVHSGTARTAAAAKDARAPLPRNVRRSIGFIR